MSQHFLLSAKARCLSLSQVMRLTDNEAYEMLKAIRWADTEGKPFCAKCDSVTVYEYQARRIFKCKGCGAQFSVTSGTIFASRKMAVRVLLAAIAIFVNGAKGHSALQLSRDLDCQYKTAFVLAHKLREAMAAADNGAKVLAKSKSPEHPALISSDPSPLAHSPRRPQREQHHRVPCQSRRPSPEQQYNATLRRCPLWRAVRTQSKTTGVDPFP